MRILCLLMTTLSLLLCSNPTSKITQKPKTPKTITPKSDTSKTSKPSSKNTDSTPPHNPLTSQTSSSTSLARWFIGVGSGVNYSFRYEKPFAMIDFKSGLTYDNEWGRSYIYANISYAYLEGWNKQAQSSRGYFLDTLFNTDLGFNLFESLDFSFLFMFGVGIGGRWIEQSYALGGSHYEHGSFFVTNLNISARMEIAKEHILALTLKPQLTKGWYQNRQLTFEYFKEMSVLLSYTFWKF